MVIAWAKRHWDECVFGVVVVALFCQVFSWLWPAQPALSPVTPGGVARRVLYKPVSTVAVKKVDEEPISLFQLAEPSLTSQPKNVSNKINVNTASADELAALPGIGPHLADRIVDYRQKTRITHLQQLDQVKGIGSKLLLKCKPYLSFE